MFTFHLNFPSLRVAESHTNHNHSVPDATQLGQKAIQRSAVWKVRHRSSSIRSMGLHSDPRTEINRFMNGLYKYQFWARAGGDQGTLNQGTLNPTRAFTQYRKYSKVSWKLHSITGWIFKSSFQPLLTSRDCDS